MNELTLTTWAPTLVLAAARAVGLLLIAPVFGQAAVPVRLRIAMGLVVALAVVGRLAGPAAPPTGWADLSAAVACEAAVGLVIGYAARVVFAGVELAALYVGQQAGVLLGEVYGGGGEAGGPVRGLFVLLMLVVFLLIGGHRVLVRALMATFATVPLRGFAPDEALLERTVAVLAASFALALRLAAPVIVAMLLATAALGMVQRTIPQLHLLSAGLPLRVLLGLVAMGLTLLIFVPLIEEVWDGLSGQIAGLVRASP